jgi:hypothetical protein
MVTSILPAINAMILEKRPRSGLHCTRFQIGGGGPAPWIRFELFPSNKKSIYMIFQYLKKKLHVPAQLSAKQASRLYETGRSSMRRARITTFP